MGAIVVPGRPVQVRDQAPPVTGAALAPVLIVSGTGTEVGKTVVTAAIAALAADRSIRVAVVKPAQTGEPPGPTGDLQTVRRLSGVTQTYELARFGDPLSPEAAARAARRPPLDLAAAAVFIKQLEADLILVEGAGGLLVRYDPSGSTIADLAVMLDAPVLVVTTPGLGTLNHTALTLEALSTRRLTPAGVVIGAWLQQLCELGRHVRIRDLIRFQKQGIGGQGKDADRNDCIGRFVRDFFLSSRVESLGIPTAIVTTDLSSGAPYVFTEGPLEIAIRATCAFPGLFKSIEYDGRLLADGCIVSPVPTRTAARMNASLVLGVAVGMDKSTPARRRVVKLFRHAKGCVKRLLESSWARQADVLVAPEVQQIEWNDFSRVDEARAAGAEAMRRALPLVRELLERQSLTRRLAETSRDAESRAAS